MHKECNMSLTGKRSGLLAPRKKGKAAVYGLVAVLALGLVRGVLGELQFDVFVGYGSSGSGDGIVREGCWFPVACEVYNDGPAFDAVFEFASLQTGGGQVRRMQIELPTNTRKRFCFPVFAGTSRYATWDARLIDSSGRLRAERPGIQVQDVSRNSFVMGGLARSFAGLPVLPQAGSNRGPQVKVARLAVAQFPDNPIALEGLNAIYVNSEKAIELNVGQVSALTSWLYGGGVLVVGIEQMQDVESIRWLRELVQAELTGTFTNQSGGEMHRWLTQTAGEAIGPFGALEEDSQFESAELFVYACTPGDNAVVVSVGGKPLVLGRRCGRGEVITLLFSPEREPFKSWKHRQWFWAKLLKISKDYFQSAGTMPYSGYSIDAVIGAMIETRQTRKLPVEWLLLLLAIYLVVIGPLDYWVLKKINRQMLTWLTFPAYVAIFSVLIYWIGYKLRAGETEWNELHLTDVFERGDGAVLRGRTFASLYSSANAKYKLALDLPTAALRAEYRGVIGGGQESTRIHAELVANSFRAEVAVPVWSSLMYVADWVQRANSPLSLEVIEDTGQLVVTIESRLSRMIGPIFLVHGEDLYNLGRLGPNQRKTIKLAPERAVNLVSFVQGRSAAFFTAATSRYQAFGHAYKGIVELTPENVVALSFAALLGGQQHYAQQWPGQPSVIPSQRGFVSPPGQDLAGVLKKGDAVLLAWDPSQSPIPSAFIHSKVPRLSRNNMYRLSVPVTYKQ